MTKPTVTIPYKLCSDLMDCLAALAYNVVGDLNLSETYAKAEFTDIMESWEKVNGFEFNIVED